MSSAGDKVNRLTGVLCAVLFFALQACVAMVIGTLLMVVAGGIADHFLNDAPPQLRSVVEAGGLLNPFAWLPGIALGFLVNRLLHGSTLRRVACWVWIVGVIWLTAAIWGSIGHYDARYYQGCSVVQNVVNAFFVFDSQRCGGGESTLAGLFFTIPAINSIGYSVGTWLALRLSALKQKRSEQL